MNKLIYFGFLLILYIVIGMVYSMYKVCYEYKYGKAVFKVNSNSYKKGIIYKKECNMKVKPFKENDEVYLPLMHVANTIGATELKNNRQNGNKILSYMGKDIRIKKNSIVVSKTENLIYYDRINNVKLVNGEIMIPINSVNDIFNLNSEYNEMTNEVIIK